ncbi:unnamed protein product [Ascophyllum nodosum]
MMQQLAVFSFLSLLGQASGFVAHSAIQTSNLHHKPEFKSLPTKCLRMGMEHLQVGSEAPPFTVKDQDGTDVTLGSFKGEKNVIVYFYSKDATSGCTMEASTFRDLKSEYDSLDCVVLGVSADDEVSHSKFIADLGLNFSLLADTNKALINAYGAVKAEDENKIQRSTVLIDKAGKIAAVWFPVTGAEQHPVEVLEKVKQITSSA